MMQKPDNMSGDRTGGIGRKLRVNPPVVYFSSDFTPKTQPPKPFYMSELGQKLRERGFADGDTEQARVILKRVSYQHVSGYFDLLKDESGSIYPWATTAALHQCVIFDRKLQALLMEYIGLFELQFRAQYSYIMSQKWGAFAHRDARNFKDESYFTSFLDTYSKEFSRQLKKSNRDISAAYELYGDAPIWLAVEIMSFGTLSMLYRNTRNRSVKDAVAKSFGVTADELESWMRSISYIRNECAHFGRICGKKILFSPKAIDGLNASNSEPFYMVLVIMRLLGGCVLLRDGSRLAHNLSMLRDFAQLVSDFPGISILCGIPGDWERLVTSIGVIGELVSFEGDFIHKDKRTGKVSITVRVRGEGDVVVG